MQKIELNLKHMIYKYSKNVALSYNALSFQHNGLTSLGQTVVNEPIAI